MQLYKYIFLSGDKKPSPQPCHIVLPLVFLKTVNAAALQLHCGLVLSPRKAIRSPWPLLKSSFMRALLMSGMCLLSSSNMLRHCSLSPSPTLSAGVLHKRERERERERA